MKILLLNLPCEKLVLRDYYCGHSSKGSYYWAPTDLLILSGTLAQEHDLHVLDAAITRLSIEETEKRILSISPDVIVFLTSGVSFYDDIKLLRAIRNKLDCSLLGTGDVLLYESEYIMENYPEIDGIITNYTSPDILLFLRGERNDLSGLIFRQGGKVISSQPAVNRTFSYPMPRHELFPLHAYSLPFSKKLTHKTTNVLSSFGCPYRCAFCQYHDAKYMSRSLDEFVDELEYVESLGVKDVFLRDLTFGPNIKRGKELCRKIIERGIKLSWNCEARVDCVDHELLELMKEAGCFCVMFGVESGSSHILDDVQKDISLKQIEEVFKYCRSIGLPTLGHFILGLPGEDEESVKKTIDFAKKLKCDYASFNLFVPRLGSKIRKQMVEDGKIQTGDFTNVDSSVTSGSTELLSNRKLKKYFRKAIFQFYMRPSQIIRLLKLTSFRTLLSNGRRVLVSAK